MAARTDLVIKGIAALMLVGGAFGFGVVAGGMRERERAAAHLDDTIAIAWGDGRHGKAFYGMRVFVEPSAAGLSVRGEVRIGPGNSMRHDAGEIGVVSSRAEAVARFGTITWREHGVHVGAPGRDEYVLERSRIESHR